MTYLAVKHLHVALAAFSGGLFALRGLLVLTSGQRIQGRLLRILPHLVDTFLLLTALTLAIWSQQYPFVQAWLTAKVCALLAYIVLGSIAIKRGSTRMTRLVAYFAALTVFAYIVLVAHTKHALPII